MKFTRDQVLELGARHPLLALLDSATLGRVVDGSRAVHYRAGRTFHNAGDAPDRMHFLLSGAAKIFVRVPNGGELLLEVYRGPAMFAEMEVIARLPFVAYAMTLEPSLLLHVPSAWFLSLIDRLPRVTRAVMEDLALRLWVSTNSLIATAFEDVDTRLAGLIAMYARCFGVPQNGSMLLDLPLTQEGMARDLGVSRKAIVKALQGLKEKGLIKKEAARYVVIDLDRLAERSSRPAFYNERAR